MGNHKQYFDQYRIKQKEQQVFEDKQTRGNAVCQFHQDFLFVWRLMNVMCELLQHLLFITVYTKLQQTEKY